MPYLMGIDVGTTGTKTVIFDLSGNIVGSAYEEYRILHPSPGCAEQKPEWWWRATRTTIKAAMKTGKISGRDVLGIGLSGQMHGAVMVDSDGKPLRDAIIWADQRSVREREWLKTKIGDDKLLELTSNMAVPTFTCLQVLWIKANQRSIFANTDKILVPKDYVRLRLTGEYATDLSDASGTLFFDVKNRRWSEALLNEIDISIDKLPVVFESQSITGEISRAAAKATGLKTGTPVVGGGADQACGAIGNGVIRHGMVSTAIGTAGVVFSCTAKPIADPRRRIFTFCHAVPNMWFNMGVMQAAGLSLKWLRDTFTWLLPPGKTKKDAYDFFTECAKNIEVGSEGLIFLPYMLGERSPHWDENARGVLFGLRLDHDWRHIVHAIMEGVVFGLRDSLEVVKELGLRPTEIRAGGGGARSELWCQMQADILGLDVYTTLVSEAPALGAAILAGVGVKEYSSVATAVDKIVDIGRKYTPSRERSKNYNRYYAIYKSLYKSLKDEFEAVARCEKC